MFTMANFEAVFILLGPNGSSRLHEVKFYHTCTKCLAACFIDSSSPVLLTWRHVHEHSCKPKTELGSSTCAKVLSHCGASNCIPSAAVICAKIRGKMYCTAIYCTARSYILNTVRRKSLPENMFGTRSESFRILLMEDSRNFFRNCFCIILQTLNRVTNFSVFILVHCYLLHCDQWYFYILHCYLDHIGTHGPMSILTLLLLYTVTFKCTYRRLHCSSLHCYEYSLLHSYLDGLGTLGRC